MSESKDNLLNVLFIEDDLAYANVLKRRLLQAAEPSFHVDHCEKLSSGLDTLAGGRTDVILLDLSLPDSKGLESLMKVHKQAPEVPVVVSTGLDDEHTGIEALQKGADDYLVKGRVDSRVVSRVLRYAIERHRQRVALKKLSLIDELTGLHNRRGFLTLAEHQIKVTHRTQIGFCLFFIDLDHFKEINDAHGHAVGDQVLINFSNILKSTFRASDVLARIGGDEFAALAVDVNETLSESLASRVREKLQRYNDRSPHPFELSISLGIERFDPRKPCYVEQLLERADKKMYTEKRNKHSGGSHDAGDSNLPHGNGG